MTCQGTKDDWLGWVARGGEAVPTHSHPSHQETLAALEREKRTAIEDERHFAMPDRTRIAELTVEAEALAEAQRVMAQHEALLELYHQIRQPHLHWSRVPTVQRALDQIAALIS